ncbi:MAG: alpha/beta hydrolase [Alphaproteobacteria bacterium]|nr:alpha/beta hydrolase [Alphaproteobacteria bacterium]
MRRAVLTLVVVLVLGYGALLAFVYAVQDRLVFFPDAGRAQVATPAAAGLAYEDVRLATEDGETLHGWWTPAPASGQGQRGALLLLHGNAGNISHRIGYLSMAAQLGYGALAIDYRGYGRSSGAPSEAGTYLDAAAAWRHLVEVRGVQADRIVVVGESLGGGAASWLATERKVGALVLASTFTSVPDLGAQVYWFLPVRLLARTRYDNRARMPRLKVPVLVAHSPADEIVPFSHGESLFGAAPPPKRFLALAGGHNEGLIYARPDWVAVLQSFLAESIGPEGG